MDSAVHPKVEAVAQAAADFPGLQLLLLFGSRARGGAQHANSDWDFGFVASPPFQPESLHAELITLLNSERVDLVDLATASALLRYRAAAEGRVLFEATAGEFRRFWMETVHFWCDAQPILQRGYDRILEQLG